MNAPPRFDEAPIDVRALPSPSEKEKGLADVSAVFFAMLVMLAFGTGGAIHHSLASRAKAVAAELRGRLAYALSPVALSLTVFSVLLCLLAFSYSPTPNDLNFVVLLCAGFGLIYGALMVLCLIFDSFVFPRVLLETVADIVMRDCPSFSFLLPVAERPPQARR